MVYADSYWDIRRLGNLVILKRTSIPYLDVLGGQISLERLIRALDGVDRASSVVLIDSRDVPPSGDPAVEALVIAATPRMIASFERAAVMVRTATGLLQSNRMIKQQGWRQLRAFASEAEALKYLAPHG